MTEVPSDLSTRMLDHGRDRPFLSLTDPTSSREALTWGAFWDRVDALRPAVRAMTDPRAPTLIFSLSQIDSIACFFAVIAEGGLPAFFPPPNRLQDSLYYREQQAASIAKIAPAGICAFDQASADALAALGTGGVGRIERPERPGDGAAALRAFCRRLDAPTTLFVQHSSGTTGTKKAVEIKGAMLAAQFRALWPIVEREAGPDVRVASWLPTYHDMGLLATLLLPLVGCARIDLVDPVSWVSKPHLLFEIIERDRATVAWMPNFAYRHYVRLAHALKPRDLSSMRLWVNCSEPCRSDDVEAFEARFATMGVREGSVLGSYAMAETVFAATQSIGTRRTLAVALDLEPGSALREGGRRVQSSGQVLPGFAVAAYADGERLAPGRYGEIGIGGECVFTGYRGLGRDAAILADGTYLTGDLGAIVDGEVYIFGRSKETVIVNGKNVFCGDLEHAIGGVAGIRPGRVASFGIDNDRTGSQDLVIVAETGSPETAPSTQEIKQLVHDMFGVTPRDILLVPDRWLVKSTSGKVSRKENLARYLEYRDAES